jgi:Ca-activated chloride channel family protein
MQVNTKLTKPGIILLLLALHANLVCAGISKTSQLRLDVAMDKSILLADSKQTAYLRVGLTGCALDVEQERAPVNIALVIDKSGSMGGEKIEKAKEAAIMAICRLNYNDIISVVTYDSTVNVLIPATKVSDKENIFQTIRSINANGSTALFAGVSKGAEEMRKFLTSNRVNRMVLLSDGLANVGPQSPAELGRLGASLIKEGISVTTIGLGTGYNEDLMTQLAYKSDGSHYFAEQASDLAGVFDSDFGRALSVVAQEVEVQIICAPGIRPVRLLGRQGQINGQIISVFINQLYSEHEKFILLEVEVPPTDEHQTRQIAAVNVKYDNMKTHTTDRLSSEIEVNFSRLKDLIEKRTNDNVMVDVVELIATERNELAMQLRDKGKIDEARKALKSNYEYLSSNAALYNSPRLKKYAIENEQDSMNLDEENYKKQRKIMRESQFQRATQQRAK